MNAFQPVNQSDPAPQASHLALTGSLPDLAAIAVKGETRVEWTIPNPASVSLDGRRGTITPSKFLEQLKVEPYFEKTISLIVQELAQNGIAISDLDRKRMGESFAEVLNNALIHGVLGLSGRQEFTELRKASEEAQLKKIHSIKLHSQYPQIIIKISVNDKKLTVTVLDGGKITPELLDQILSARASDNKKMTEIMELKSTGADVSEEQEEFFQAYLTAKSGRGTDITTMFFPELRGLNGGVEISHQFS